MGTNTWFFCNRIKIKSQDVFKQAQAFADSVTTGKVKASEPVDTETASTEESGEDAPF